jgi:quinol monooxygenase YgiN
MANKVNVGLLVRLEAKPGKEAEVAQFLKSALPIVQEETGTATWYAIQMGKNVFGIFDTFESEEGRGAHLAGRVAAALMAKAPELLASAPVIEKIDILASKLP